MYSCENTSDSSETIKRGTKKISITLNKRMVNNDMQYNIILVVRKESDRFLKLFLFVTVTVLCHEASSKYGIGS